jgi:hypothetical protein
MSLKEKCVSIKMRLNAINLADEITQFEMVCSVERISEHFLKSVLERILETFPFVIQGVHSDNASEYINKTVAELPQKLLQ